MVHYHTFVEMKMLLKNVFNVTQNNSMMISISGQNNDNGWFGATNQQ